MIKSFAEKSSSVFERSPWETSDHTKLFFGKMFYCFFFTLMKNTFAIIWDFLFSSSNWWINRTLDYHHPHLFYPIFKSQHLDRVVRVQFSEHQISWRDHNLGENQTSLAKNQKKMGFRRTSGTHVLQYSLKRGILRVKSF